MESGLLRNYDLRILNLKTIFTPNKGTPIKVFSTAFVIEDCGVYGKGVVESGKDGGIYDNMGVIKQINVAS